MSSHDQDDFRSTDELLEEAEGLIWALLDEQLDDASARRLGAMMEQSDAVRSRYIDCVQLHVDLSEHFGRPAPTEPGSATAPSRPVVLPNLLPGLPGSHPMPHGVE